VRMTRELSPHREETASVEKRKRKILRPSQIFKKPSSALTGEKKKQSPPAPGEDATRRESRITNYSRAKEKEGGVLRCSHRCGGREGLTYFWLPQGKRRSHHPHALGLSCQPIPSPAIFETIRSPKEKKRERIAGSDRRKGKGQEFRWEKKGKSCPRRKIRGGLPQSSRPLPQKRKKKQKTHRMPTLVHSPAWRKGRCALPFLSCGEEGGMGPPCIWIKRNRLKREQYVVRERKKERASPVEREKRSSLSFKPKEKKRSAIRSK